MLKKLFALAICTMSTQLLGGCASKREIPPEQVSVALPEGRWTGTITSRTIPDVDNDGEWDDFIAIENCGGRTRIRFKGNDGEYGIGIDLGQYSLPKTYLLISAATEHQDGSGWSESQVWTLVDARPKDWTITQSRSVINQQMSPEEPWFTFRRLAWGSLQHDPGWCSRGEKQG